MRVGLVLPKWTHVLVRIPNYPNKSFMSRNCDIHIAHLHTIFPVLINSGLIEPVKPTGSAKNYGLTLRGKRMRTYLNKVFTLIEE